MTDVLPIATCPCCGLRDQAEAITYQASPMDSGRIPHPAGQFWCARCNLIYTGSEVEWHRGRLDDHPLREWRQAEGKHPSHTEEDPM